MFLWNANYMYRVPVNVEDEFCILEGIQVVHCPLGSSHWFTTMRIIEIISVTAVQQWCSGRTSHN